MHPQIALALLLPGTLGLFRASGSAPPIAAKPRAVAESQAGVENPKTLIRQVTLKVETIPSTSAMPVKVESLEQEARAWLSSGGVKVLGPGEAASGTTHDLQVHVFTNHSDDGLYWHGVVAQCAPRMDTAARRGEPAPSPRPDQPRSSFHILGQKNLAGFEENLTATIHRSLLDLLGESLGSPGSPKWMRLGMLVTRRFAGQDPDVLNFNFEQLKIRKQPPPPGYPPSAKERGVQGTVVIDVLVDGTGTPVSAEAMSGPNELLETSIRYALSWEFEPALFNGKPKAVRFKLTMPFKLK